MLIKMTTPLLGPAFFKERNGRRTDDGLYDDMLSNEKAAASARARSAALAKAMGFTPEEIAESFGKDTD